MEFFIKPVAHLRGARAEWAAASLAVACGLHPRLGAESLVRFLPQCVLADVARWCRPTTEMFEFPETAGDDFFARRTDYVERSASGVILQHVVINEQIPLILGADRSRHRTNVYISSGRMPDEVLRNLNTPCYPAFSGEWPKTEVLICHGSVRPLGWRPQGPYAVERIEDNLRFQFDISARARIPAGDASVLLSGICDMLPPADFADARRIKWWLK